MTDPKSKSGKGAGDAVVREKKASFFKASVELLNEPLDLIPGKSHSPTTRTAHLVARLGERRKRHFYVGISRYRVVLSHDAYYIT